MKKYLSLIIILIPLLFNCTVNNTTGSITITNYSNKDAWNIKIGKNYILFLGRGQTTTFYFYQTESNASISIDGFLPFTYSDNEGEGIIDLNLNYCYGISLSKSNENYKYICSGTPIGKSDLLSTDIIWME